LNCTNEIAGKRGPLTPRKGGKKKTGERGETARTGPLPYTEARKEDPGREAGGGVPVVLGKAKRKGATQEGEGNEIHLRGALSKVEGKEDRY